MALPPIRALDRQQQKHRWLAIPVAVVKKYSDDQGGNLAALIAYYAFFSLFPLLLLLTTVLGYFLHGDPAAQRSIENSVLGQFPVIGGQLKQHALQGSVTAVVVGALGALWGGLGVTNAAQQAFDRLWAVPIKDRPDFFMTRARGIALLLVLGTLSIAASIASGLVSGGLGGVAVKIAGIAVSLVLNLVLFMTAFRLLTSASVATRCLWKGAVIAAVLWEILQIVGGAYIGHVVRHASPTYGLFTLVIGLLVWLHLAATVTLYSAEINVVLERRLWPRSLLAPTLPGDQRTLTSLAKVEERSDSEHIDVEFDHG
jgi:YihY family inner membrane protein